MMANPPRYFALFALFEGVVGSVPMDAMVGGLV